MNINLEKELVNKYLDGVSSTQLLSEYNLKYLNAVTNIVKKHGYNVRKVGVPKRITYNQDRFLNLYPETAYWYGFLYADGCLLKNKSTTYLQIQLNNKDRNMLERFMEYFEIEGTQIYNCLTSATNSDKTFNHCKICFSIDNEIENIISNFGIVQRKTLKSFMPSVIEDKEILIRNFIRGYFDGDGGVSLYKKKNGHGDKYNEALSISWLGCYDFLVWLQGQFSKYLNEDRLGKIGKRTSIYGFSWGRQALILKFYAWIYDGNYYMERKYNKISLFLHKKDLI
jgi:hypothetical protein